MLVIENMIESDHDMCAQICQSQLLEMLIAITEMTDDVERKR